MCGIIGYTSKQKNDAKDIVLACLKNLEYRGYDSAGIAIVNDNKVKLYKSSGKIENLEKSIQDMEIFTQTAMAHTRWATHGEPNEINAHPHQVGNVTLIHNGIIENYIELKNILERQGFKFKSNTDTEVACAYIDYIYESEKNKLECIKKACKTFKGSYAFGIIFDDEPNTLYATRKDSPLIIGVGDHGNFIASDVSAILDYTKNYILLDENEYAKITNNDICIYTNTLVLVQKEIKVATWNATEYKKNGFDHFMLKEIYEQPKVIQNVFNRYIDNENIYSIDFSKYTNIHIVACGSAMHAGLIGKSLFETYANIPVVVDVASEYRYKNQLITPTTLVIVISQSGETADTLAALRIAKENNAYTLAIVNAVGSTISREADQTVYTYAGPEIAVATTKGYTSQVAVLSTLVLIAMKQRKLLNEDFKEEIYNDYKNIEKYLEDVISYREKYLDIAKMLYDKNHIFFIGRNMDASISMEGSLKLKEISYIHSEAYGAGELKHGTISLIDNGTPVIALATGSELLYEKTVSNIKETKARGAHVILISTDNYNTNTNDFCDINILLPKTTQFCQAILVATALQLIAYETAKLKECDIDQPKNLAKSVTVE